jgi:hypothetical protein
VVNITVTEVAIRTTNHHLRAIIEIERVGQNVNAKMTRMIHRLDDERKLLMLLILLQRMMKARRQTSRMKLLERTPKMKEARVSDLAKRIEKVTERSIIGRVGEVEAVVGVAVEVAAMTMIITIAMDMDIIIIVVVLDVTAAVKVDLALIPGTMIQLPTPLRGEPAVVVVVADIRIETERLRDEVVDKAIAAAAHHHRRRRLVGEIAKIDQHPNPTTIAVTVENGNRVESRLQGDVGTAERTKSNNNYNNSSNHNSNSPKLFLVELTEQRQVTAATTTTTIIRRMVPHRPGMEKIKTHS